MYFETKTERELNRLKKYFFYIWINAIILPITGMQNINDVLGHIINKHNVWQVEKILDENVIQKSKFFLLYLLTSAFVIQAVNLVDVPHWFNVWFEKRKVSQVNKQKFKGKFMMRY